MERLRQTLLEPLRAHRNLRASGVDDDLASEACLDVVARMVGFMLPLAALWHLLVEPGSDGKPERWERSNG